MESTAECRWWTPGRWDDRTTGWFRRQGGEAEPEHRIDHYLRIPDRPGIGVKARAGELLEVKVLGGRGPVVRFADRASGHVEHWRKWSFPVASDAPGVADLDVTERDWIRVTKRRWRHDLHGCELELAEVEIAGRWWRSLGAEASDASGGGDAVRAALQELLARADGRLGDLGPADSHGYPQQLLLVTRDPRTADSS